MSEPSVDVLAAQVRERLEAARNHFITDTIWHREGLAALEALVARVTEATSARDFWKQRYDTQHGTVHRMEDALADARNALEQVKRSPDPKWINDYVDEVLARLDGSSGE